VLVLVLVILGITAVKGWTLTDVLLILLGAGTLTAMPAAPRFQWAIG
jgi:hypothetical protein